MVFLFGSFSFTRDDLLRRMLSLFRVVSFGLKKGTSHQKKTQAKKDQVT